MRSFSQYITESQWDRHYIAAGVSPADRAELARLEVVVADRKTSPSKKIAARDRQAYILGKYRLFGHVPVPMDKSASERIVKWSQPKMLGNSGVEYEIRSKDGRFVIRKWLRLEDSPYTEGPFGYQLIDLKNRDNRWDNLNFLKDAKDEADEIMETEAAAKKAAGAKAPKAQQKASAARKKR